MYVTGTDYYGTAGDNTTENPFQHGQSTTIEDDQYHKQGLSNHLVYGHPMSLIRKSCEVPFGERRQTPEIQNTVVRSQIAAPTIQPPPAGTA